MSSAHDILTAAGARAQAMGLPYAGALTPPEAYALWRSIAGAVLVDCRTRAEQDWVGRVPGAVEIEWMSYPSMSQNPPLSGATSCAGRS